MLKDLTFKYQYRSNQDQLFKDFYHPCLLNSNKYDRASGYFTSESLKLISRGLEVFLENKGQIRIVANPLLTSEDIEAIELGYIAKEKVIENTIIKEIELTYKNIEAESLNVISWLIYKEQLEFKFAFPKNNALYHEKFGIFTDEDGHSVSFTGSANETYRGLSDNFEKIDVYTSNEEGHRIEAANTDFDNLWHNTTEGLDVFDLPTSIKKKLIDSRSPKPPVSNKKKENVIEIREYQANAIENWLENDGQGIFSMATGTGKTITSLMAAKEMLKKRNSLATVIIVPFIHLVDQWQTDIEKILGEALIRCHGSKDSWVKEANEYVQDFNLGLIDDFVVITTYATARSSKFKNIFRKISGNTLLIADECHTFTIKSYKDFPFRNFKYTLGLSATPQRWWDEEGTEFIYKTIGDVVFSYTIDQAIDNEMLTEYKYYPHIIDLEEDEMEKYNRYTKRIIKLFNKDDDESQERLKRLFHERALIISKARNKIPMFLQHLQEKGSHDLSHTLVYCAPGEISTLTKAINNLGIKVSKFNSDLNRKQREKILKMFEEESIQVLVAIKCLDEGVDVPATKRAYFLASTSNPKEFVQRRGRVLRKHENKTISIVHDYITLPNNGEYEDFYSIATKELPRFAEFNSSAINRASMNNIMIEILHKYNLTNLLYKKPWQVYHESKESKYERY